MLLFNGLWLHGRGFLCGSTAREGKRGDAGRTCDHAVVAWGDEPPEAVVVVVVVVVWLVLLLGTHHQHDGDDDDGTTATSSIRCNRW